MRLTERLRRLVDLPRFFLFDFVLSLPPLRPLCVRGVGVDVGVGDGDGDENDSDDDVQSEEIEVRVNATI